MDGLIWRYDGYAGGLLKLIFLGTWVRYCIVLLGWGLARMIWIHRYMYVFTEYSVQGRIEVLYVACCMLLYVFFMLCITLG